MISHQPRQSSRGQLFALASLCYYFAQMPQSLIKSLAGLLFPKFCVGCKNPGGLLCEHCLLKVQFIYEQCCPACQHPSIGGLTHPRCKSPWGVDGLASIAYYRGPIRTLIRQLKYTGATVTSELIEQLIVEYQKHETIILPPAIITAIPLDKQTLKSRGFNQSEIVAQILSQKIGYPYVPSILQRQRKVVSQTKLSKDERRQNMQDAFSLAPDVVHTIKSSTIIVVDDVFTTGATLREAAKVLKRAGAAQVYGFTFAQD